MEMDSCASYAIDTIRWELKWQDFYYTDFLCNKSLFLYLFYGKPPNMKEVILWTVTLSPKLLFFNFLFLCF